MNTDRSDALPSGWSIQPIGSVCAVNPKKPATDALKPSDPVTFVPMPAVDADSGAINEPLSRAFADVRKGFTAFANEDVIVAKITPCFENGKAALCRGLTNGLGFGSTEFHVLRCTDAVIPEYIYHFVRQESFRRDGEANMTGSVGQKRVPADWLKAVEIPLPPLAEQRRIVEKVEAVLARVNAARQRLAKLPALLKRFRQSTLAAACSGRLTADWRENHPGDATRLLAEVSRQRGRTAPQYEADFPVLPAGWVATEFGFLLGELRNGISVKPNMQPPGTPILRINAVRSGRVLYDDVRFMPDADNLAETYGLRERDLLFTRYNGSIELLGVCGMVRSLPASVLLYPDKLMRVRFDHANVLPEYVEVFFQAPLARDRLMDRAKSSAGQQGVSGKDIKEQPILIPPLPEQHEIVRRVEALFALADKIEVRIAAAAAQANKLIQSTFAKAFRGELVPTDAELTELDGREFETAHELLDRIHDERNRVAPSPERNGSRQSASVAHNAQSRIK